MSLVIRLLVYIYSEGKYFVICLRFGWRGKDEREYLNEENLLENVIFVNRIYFYYLKMEGNYFNIFRIFEIF